MWNQSKWILWILLFIYIPQVIYDLVSGLLVIPNLNAYISGMSRANFIHHCNLTKAASIFNYSFLKSQLSKSLMYLFAVSP